DADKVKRPPNVDYYQYVTSGYFQAMGLRLVEGRFLDQRDSLKTPNVCVINRTMARAFWGNKNALGRRIRPGFDGPWVTIVGIIEDAKNAGVDQPAGTELYLSLAQSPAARMRAMFVVAKSHGELDALAKTIRGIVHDVAPGVPLSRIR